MKKLNTQDKDFLDHCCRIIQPSEENLKEMKEEQEQKGKLRCK